MVIAVNGYVNISGIVEGHFPPGAYNYPAAISVVEHLADANAAAYDAIHRARPPRARRLRPQHDRLHARQPQLGAGRGGDRARQLPVQPPLPRRRDQGLSRPERRRGGRTERAQPEPGGKADFVGVNYYFRGRVTGLGGPLTPTIPILDFLPATSYRSSINPSASPCPTTCSDFGNEIYPDGFRQVLDIAGDYGRPVYVTENGISDADDNQRPGFLNKTTG